ncbi:hypothetical protein AALO_G00156310 [Alosa alosa]|uniref:Uncharacterized protein n=1 Tax=Alosa alosa TaxID=278164 RepID=A0AAV6GFJ9_9TELE|nr:hypothetical protein AALO_G00156310 [Alosa alosa]
MEVRFAMSVCERWGYLELAAPSSECRVKPSLKPPSLLIQRGAPRLTDALSGPSPAHHLAVKTPVKLRPSATRSSGPCTDLSSHGTSLYSDMRCPESTDVALKLSSSGAQALTSPLCYPKAAAAAAAATFTYVLDTQSQKIPL